MTDPQDPRPAHPDSSLALDAEGGTLLTRPTAELPTLELREERLVVSKERVVAGTLSVRREVRRETVQVPVELHREVLVIEHAGPSSGPGVMLDGTWLAPGERRELVIYQEEARVEKQVVAVEEVRLSKRTVTEQHTVEASLGREVLTVHEEGTVRGLSPEPPEG